MDGNVLALAEGESPNACTAAAPAQKVMLVPQLAFISSLLTWPGETRKLLFYLVNIQLM